jgi:hypothetical protein
LWSRRIKLGRLRFQVSRNTLDSNNQTLNLRKNPLCNNNNLEADSNSKMPCSSQTQKSGSSRIQVRCNNRNLLGNNSKIPACSKTLTSKCSRSQMYNSSNLADSNNKMQGYSKILKSGSSRIMCKVCNSNRNNLA